MSFRAAVCGLLAIAAPIRGVACDACGCSASGPATLGLLPATSRSFAGLSTQHQTFRTPLPDGSTAVQAYTSIQAWGRISAGRRLQLYAFLPYRANNYRHGATTARSSGIGDVSVLLQAALLRRPAADGRVGQVLLAGVGVKAPTGRHRSGAEAVLLGLPNAEPGTGAWDGQLAASYTLTGRWAGFNAEASYTLTTPNAEDYKYGNWLGAGSTAFLRLRAGKTEWLPLAGARYELLLHDYDRFSRRWLNRQSGGSVAYGQLGIQAYRGRVGLSAQLSRPLWQAPAGNIAAGTRADAGVTVFL